MHTRRVSALTSNRSYCNEMLARLRSHLGYFIADKPYSCLLVIQRSEIPKTVFDKCYVVYIDDQHRAFAAEVELVVRCGTTEELYFGTFLPFVQEGCGLKLEIPGTHIVLGPCAQFLEFPSVVSAQEVRGSRNPMGITS